jgi:methionyl-tRNA synthetase
MNKFYITTAIDYINGKPHIGHSYEKVASDVLARYYRSQGLPTLFLTGTDEHGAKIAQFAESSNLPIEEFANQTAAGFALAWDQLNISYDRFIRTTDGDHIQTVQNLITKIKDNGYLYESDYEGLYCVGHEAFITEKDLVDGMCPEHQKAPELIKEKNWFFKVSAFTDQIKQKIDDNEFRIWPEERGHEVLSLLAQGFKDIAVTRPNIKWGIPVPWDTEQTIYVWVDALINYVSGAGYVNSQEQFKEFWPADWHVIGKDIIKFHCIIWPALLLAADLPLPKGVLAHGYLTVNNQKISKSLGNAIDPNDWVAKYGSDAVRYFLLREVPFDADGDVSEEKLRARYEGDLANGLGNLVSRVTTLVEKYADGTVPVGTFSFEDEEVDKLMLDFKFHEALAKIWEWVAWANKTVDENKLWELGKTDKEKFAAIAADLLATIHVIGLKLAPFMPEASAKISALFAAEKITKAEPLFPRVE